jgi:type IV pilus assembly protein PilB
MGVPPFLITATLEGVLAQRLVRKICANCREEMVPSTEQLAELDLSPDEVVGKKFYRGRGCPTCNNSGFKGRTGLFELMPMNDTLRELVNRGASAEALRDAALRGGMHSLRACALEKLYAGVTTIDEAVRETVVDI